jgi:hypothetical protein
MTLIYVYIGGSKASSVQQKVVNQVKEMNAHGMKAIGWFFTQEVEVDTSFGEYIVLKPLKNYSKKYEFFQKNYEEQFHYKQIIEALKDASFDILFIRHGSPGTAYFKMLKQWANKIYLYIPSNSIAENFQERKANKSNSTASWIIGWFQYFWFIWFMHYRLFWFVLPKLKGVVAFTPEFAKMLKLKSLSKAKTIYNRDGADCPNVKVRTFLPMNPKVYSFVFLKGSSMQQPWAGLERLIASIKARPDIPCQLYITGKVYNPEDFQESFIQLTDRLEDDKLAELINGVDVGVSNLANYMIQFNETTNLKSRDYYARGLPFIQANTMPDIEGTKGADYYLNLPNNSQLIDMDKVVSFIEKMRKNHNHPNEMRNYAEENLSWNKTVGELIKNI